MEKESLKKTDLENVAGGNSITCDCDKEKDNYTLYARWLPPTTETGDGNNPEDTSKS